MSVSPYLQGKGLQDRHDMQPSAKNSHQILTRCNRTQKCIPIVDLHAFKNQFDLRNKQILSQGLREIRNPGCAEPPEKMGDRPQCWIVQPQLIG